MVSLIDGGPEFGKMNVVKLSDDLAASVLRCGCSNVVKERELRRLLGCLLVGFGTANPFFGDAESEGEDVEVEKRGAVREALGTVARVLRKVNAGTREIGCSTIGLTPIRSSSASARYEDDTITTKAGLSVHGIQRVEVKAFADRIHLLGHRTRNR